MVNWLAPWNLLARTHVRLNQPVFKEEKLNEPFLWTAREAWLHSVQAFKWKPENFAVKDIESLGNVNSDGSAFGWRFCVDVLDQQATAVVVWEILQSTEGCPLGSRLRSTLSPYPMVGSPVHRVVAQGYGNERLLNAAWLQMREHAHDIPSNFIDSDQAVLDLFERGWVGPYHLRTTLVHDTLMWEAFHNGKTQHTLLIPYTTHAPMESGTAV